MQRAFYYDYNSIVRFGDANATPYRFTDEKINDFSELLRQ